jgi:hypothetical protein
LHENMLAFFDTKFPIEEGSQAGVYDNKFRRVVGYSKSNKRKDEQGFGRMQKAIDTQDPLQVRHAALAGHGQEEVQDMIKNAHAGYFKRGKKRGKYNKFLTPMANGQFESFLSDLNLELNEEALSEGESYDNHYYVVGMIRNRHKAVLSGPHQFNDEQLRAHLHSTGDSYFKKHKGLTRLRALKGKDLVDHGFTQTYKKYMSVDEGFIDEGHYRVTGTYENPQGKRVPVAHHVREAHTADHAKDQVSSKFGSSLKNYKPDNATLMGSTGHGMLKGKEFDVVREEVELDEAWNPNEVHNMHTRLVSHGVAQTKLKSDHDYGKFSQSYHSHGSPEEHKKFTNRLLDNLIKHRFEPMTHVENGPSEFGARHWRHRSGMHVDIIHGKNGTEVQSYDNSYLKKMQESVNESHLVPFKSLNKGDTYSPVDPVSKKPVWDDAKGAPRKHTLSQKPVPTHKGHWTSVTTTGHRPIHHGDEQVLLHEGVEVVEEGAMSEIHAQIPKVYKNPELVHAETGKEGEKFAVVKAKLSHEKDDHFHVLRYHPSHGWNRMSGTARSLTHAKQRIVANINGGELKEGSREMMGGMFALIDKVSKKIVAKGSRAELKKKLAAYPGQYELGYTYRAIGHPYTGDSRNVKEEVEQLDELSKEKLGWYLKKASKHVAKKGENMIKRDKKFETHINPQSRQVAGAFSRADSIATASKKYLAKEEIELDEERKGKTPAKEPFSFAKVKEHLDNAHKASYAHEPANVHKHLSKAHDMIKDHPKLGFLSKHINTIYSHNENGAQHHVGQGIAYVKNAVSRADPDNLK